MTPDLVSHVGQSTFNVDDEGKKERGNTKQADLPATPRKVAQIDQTGSLNSFKRRQTLVRSSFARTRRSKEEIPKV